MGRINAANIQLWICFEIAKAIGLSENFLIAKA